MTKAGRFTQSDLARAARGVRDAGFDVASVEIAPDGTIRILTQAPPKVERQLSALEAWEREHGLGAA